MATSFSSSTRRAGTASLCRRFVTTASSTTAPRKLPSQKFWLHHDKSPLLLGRMTTKLTSTAQQQYQNHVPRRTMVMVTQTKVSDLPPPINEDNATDQVQEPSSSFAQFSENSDVLIVTPSCIQRIERLVAQRVKKDGGEKDDGDQYYLRVFVDAGGCSGFTYKFELDSEPLDEEEDIVVHYAVIEKEDGGTQNIPRLVVDETSLGFIRGSKIDYVQEMIKSSFEVADNPQSESACGCGSSFALKNFAANPAID